MTLFVDADACPVKEECIRAAERLKVLGTARSQAKKARIFSFPMQFAMARERLRSFRETGDADGTTPNSSSM